MKPKREALMEQRRFYEPRGTDVVVVLPGQRWVSLAALAAAGIDTGRPFLVWADPVTSTVSARQDVSWFDDNPGRLFEGVLAITGTPGDEESEYIRGHEEGFEEGKEEGFEEGKEAAVEAAARATP